MAVLLLRAIRFAVLLGSCGLWSLAHAAPAIQWDAVEWVDQRGGAEAKRPELAGKPLLIYVWGDWCRACQKSSPVVRALADRYPDLRMVALNTDDPAKTFFFEGSTDRLDLYPDPGVFGPQAFRQKAFRMAGLGLVFGVPAYYLVDSDGFVVAQGNGSRYADQLVDRVAGLLAAQPKGEGR